MYEKSVNFLAMAMIAVVMGCGPNGESSNSAAASNQLRGKLVITGSSTVAPLVTEIAKRFEQLHPEVRIDVQTGGSGKGIADARNGISDIGMASRPLKPDENDLVAHQIAADGVGMIIHQSNPIRELTDTQIIDIYSGKIKNWKDVGGQNQPLIVVHKAEGRATLEVFLQYFHLDNSIIKADVIVGDNQHGVKTVAGAQGSIGYVSIGTAEAEIKFGTPIQLLPIGGVPASTATVASGQFPVSRPLNLVTIDSKNDLANQFINYCQSIAVHDLITAQHFVPMSMTVPDADSVSGDTTSPAASNSTTSLPNTSSRLATQ